MKRENRNKLIGIAIISIMLIAQINMVSAKNQKPKKPKKDKRKMITLTYASGISGGELVEFLDWEILCSDGTWYVIASGTTDASGMIPFTEKVGGDYEYRLRIIGGWQFTDLGTEKSIMTQPEGILLANIQILGKNILATVYYEDLSIVPAGTKIELIFFHQDIYH